MTVGRDATAARLEFADDGKRGAGGTGLGLNIVCNMATARLGGHIRCESAIGQGTRFILTLPLGA
jgi:signal transduction histidine kinase